VYCLGSFHQKCGRCFLLPTLAHNIEKTLNPIIFPCKFESTLCTLDINVAQFPSVMENNIKIRNTCPSEVISINTEFENNEKPWNYEMHYKVPKQYKFHQKKTLKNQCKLLKTSFTDLEKKVYVKSMHYRRQRGIVPFLIASSSSTMRILCTRERSTRKPFQIWDPSKAGFDSFLLLFLVQREPFCCGWCQCSRDFVGWTIK
jgi:hypothetical protein